ncbi:MAG: FAD-dependent oxidoreductase [Fidelibacterota bacterium]|nr:MAG: FAD-dependent oxidoreductase [Candidatus Neomarinimicrobiota bacterium]
MVQIEELLGRKRLSFAFEEGDRGTHPIGLVEPSPCTRACPAGVNVKAYVSLIATGRFHEALEVVRQRNPLPGICGRVCTHPCEAVCNLGEIDSPVAVCWLKRFVADYELAHPQAIPEPISRTRKEKVAIVGSGPAGLTAANDLVRLGFGVTVFEALPVAGGMLVAGIPAYRLPRDIVETEIAAIEHLGVEIKTNKPISGEKAIDQLFDGGYSAVFLAIGAHKGLKLGVPGEDEFKGIIDCITFLNEVNLSKGKKPGDKVIVIGGGSSAVDSARTALRLGSDEVYIVYRRSRKEMPAHEAEISAAEQEGVKLHYLAAPVNILGENGKVTGMECQKMKLGKPDSSGRRRPVPIEGSEFVVQADTIITAISQGPDLTNLPGDQGVELTRWNTFAAEEESMATSRPGVFAGGDAVTGPSTVIDAIAAGHVAARSIVRYLNGDPLVQAEIRGEPLESEIKVDQKQREHKKRTSMPMLKVSTRINSFDEVDLGFKETQAVAEAQRCLRCGPCSECFICVPECDKITAILTSPEKQGECIFRLPHELLPSISGDGPADAAVQAGAKKTIPFQVTPVIPWVREDLCRGCADCVDVCEHMAVTLISKEPALSSNEGEYISVANVNSDICRGCGTCVAVCSTGAMTPGYYSGDWLPGRLATLVPGKKNIVVFACHWNGSHPDDEAIQNIGGNGTHIEVIHTMCSGRISPGLVFQAFELGADGVLLTGCSPDNCHYGFGAKQAHNTYGTIEQLIHLVGIEPERIAFQHVSDSNTAAFLDVVSEFVQNVEKPKPRPAKSRKVLVQ